MSNRKKRVISVCTVSFIACILCFTSITLAQDEASDAKIIERYKSMLNRKPKEGSTFDRLYQFYLEGAGLDAMVAIIRQKQQLNLTRQTSSSSWDIYTNALGITPRQSMQLSTCC